MIGARVYLLLHLLIISLLLHGCAGAYRVVEFEVLEPATVEFPDNVQQLVFLNRAPISLDIWAEQNQDGMDIKQLVLLDTMIINNLLRGVLAVIRDSPAHKFHMPIWLNERRADTAMLDDLELTRREVDLLCDTMKCDAVISLEYYTVGLEQHFEYYIDNPDEVMTHYFEAYNALKWNIHLPGSPRPFDSYSMVDTLFFPFVLDGQMQDYVPGADMLRQLFYASGYKYGKYLVPVWNPASRILYSGRDDSLKQAIQHTDDGEWDQAYAIWRNMTKAADDSTLVAKAYHNMAVYLELEDNLDSASLMLDLALAHDTLELDTLYREELDVRIMNRENIRKQVR